ncbi:hypothetical protein EVAR_33513_1 [Eumeta japonica]|uniref:Uncharacterized protein n=1 Tax=Eumeta variegata TaxID=151549 RepID=A0A4C1VLW8_EUMVA|nr:hypothetical protein EVAR_33513_1 [Eumeta japonica]
MTRGLKMTTHHRGRFRGVRYPGEEVGGGWEIEKSEGRGGVHLGGTLELARAEEECARALYKAAKAKQRLACVVKARTEADISSEEKCEVVFETERSRERVKLWLETQPLRDDSFIAQMAFRAGAVNNG